MPDKFSFLDYKDEILKVQKEQTVDIGDAYDKFRTDVRLGKAHPYNTGEVLKDFDFEAAKAKWDKLSKDEQEACYEEWHNVMG